MTDDVDDLDDTVLTEDSSAVEDTAPLASRRTAPKALPVTNRALPPQAPPVTDIYLLEFRPPEVPSGGVARYRARIGLEVIEVPDFDAEWRVHQRAPRSIGVAEVMAHQQDARLAWRRRVLLTVTVVTAVAVALGALGLWALSRL